MRFVVRLAPIAFGLPVIGLLACAESPSHPQVPAVVMTVLATPPSEPIGSRVETGDTPEPFAPVWAPGDPLPSAWLHPDQAVEPAPERFNVVFATTKGEFAVLVVRSWAPHGADRFYNLVRMGYYTDIAVFRAIPGFMVQFGIHGVPEVNDVWREARIPDDPVVRSNERGAVTFAMAGPGSRTVQLFINTVDNTRLDAMSFAPFGEVVAGMSVVDSLYTGYGEGAPSGAGPSQAELQRVGNPYVRAGFPKIDFVTSVRLASGSTR
jgi:peptidyl-prolyl cis-trans isomerase A (cyclophilin A)